MILNLKSSENGETKKNEIKEEEKIIKNNENNKNNKKENKTNEKIISEKSDNKNSNKKSKNEEKLKISKKNTYKSSKNSTTNEYNDLFSNTSNSNNYNTEDLKKRIKLLEKKAENLENKNIYYYNVLKKNLNYKKEYNGPPDPVGEYIDLKRNINLNGFNRLMIDINDKINDFIEDEIIRDKEKIEYYNRVNELKDDIVYRIRFIKMLQEKERKKDIERNDINRNFYIINYNKKSGEIDPNTNNYIYNYERKYDLPHYGNPYDRKSYNNDRYMMPARISKNGMSMSNEFITIDNRGEYYKYKIYDRYNNDYKKYKHNSILKKSGSDYINGNEDFINYKYNNNKRKRISSSTDNIFSYY